MIGQPIGGTPRTFWTRHKTRWGYRMVCHGNEITMMDRYRKRLEAVISKPWDGWAPTLKGRVKQIRRGSPE